MIPGLSANLSTSATSGATSGSQGGQGGSGTGAFSVGGGLKLTTPLVIALVLLVVFLWRGKK